MSAHPNNANHSTEGEYEDLLSLWSDLESALSMLLSRPLQVQDFAAKVRALTDLMLEKFGGEPFWDACYARRAAAGLPA